MSFLRILPTSNVQHLRDEQPDKVSIFLGNTENRHFLKSLDDEMFGQEHFKDNKVELTNKLFGIYCEDLFPGLRGHVHIKWNTRLCKKAGRCRNIITENGRISVIQLSARVLNSAARLRDTLIHEMCHAACCIYNGITNDGHGLYWQLWTEVVRRTYPELPVIRQYHFYHVERKYIYRCKKCTYSIYRHKKSHHTERHGCYRCRGEFQLFSRSDIDGSLQRV